MAHARTQVRAFAAATKLVIHFCDSPGYGREYADAGVYDMYPGGDPSGETCEQHLKQLARRGIDLHFAEISSRTEKMIRVWKKKVFNGNDACRFEVHEVCA
jgi:hypothetical protein